MKTTLITTHYTWKGQPESFTSAYLPRPGETAEEQAREFWDAHSYQADDEKKITYTESDAYDAVELRALFTRDELPLAIGRICALTAIDNGFPAVPEGETYGAWKKRTAPDAFQGDMDFLREACPDLTDREKEVFFEAFCKELFKEAPLGKPLEE